MPSPKWMPLYPEDYRRDTRHLSLAEHGAYFLLIMHYWENGPLPADLTRLARIVGIEPRRFRAIFASLRDYFIEADDEQLLGKCLRHKRIDREREKAETLSLKRAYAGGKGGLAPRKPRGFRTLNSATMEQLPGNWGIQSTKKKDLLVSSQSNPAPQQESLATELVVGELPVLDPKCPTAETRAEYDARLAAKRSAAPEPEAPRRRITMAEYAVLIEARRRG